ncbi:MAG: outer membrane beta-barrel protein [Candidatus Brocadiia bacterium]|jgi:hypothetical protein
MRCNWLKISARALAASLCAAGYVCAADAPTGAASEPAGQSAPATPPPAAAPEVWPPGLIMDSLKDTSIGKVMDDLGLRLWGAAEIGFTGRLTNGESPLPLRDYDAPRPDSLRLNQVQLTLDRPYDSTKSFDFGGRFDLLYGGDARFTHAAGLADHIGGMGNDDFQWADVLQAYGQLWFKTGSESGLELTFGKFLTLVGSESAEATNNLLYSHSDIYTFLEPTTHTGGVAKYIFSSQVYAYFGIVEGWDVVEDNNTAESYLAGVSWSSKAQVSGHAQTQASLNIITGPERTDDNSDCRTLTDVVINQSWTDKLTESLNFDWLAEENVPGIAHKRADAYGAAHYLTYICNDYISGTWRLEEMRDDGGWRTGVNGDLYESTIGASLTPAPNHAQLKNLVLRPEFRCDWSDNPDAFGHGHESQLTLAMDLIYKF